MRGHTTTGQEQHNLRVGFILYSLEKNTLNFRVAPYSTQHALRRIGIVSTLASLMIVLATLLTVVLGYDNGVARTPPMGWNCKS